MPRRKRWPSQRLGARAKGSLPRRPLVIQTHNTPLTPNHHNAANNDADRQRERWDGAWVGPEAARDVFGADEVHLARDLPRRLLERAAAAPTVLFDFDRPAAFEFGKLRAAVQAATAAGGGGAVAGGGAALGTGGSGGASVVSSSGAGAAAPAGPRVQPLRPLMHRLRWRKSPAELRLMRASALVAGAAVARCVGLTRPGVREGALAAAFEFECRVHGASRVAYPSVVAGGADACTIHYGRNDKRAAAGQLMLMDAGCELGGYASDVTRTWPVGGRITSAQRDVYEVGGPCQLSVSLSEAPPLKRPPPFTNRPPSTPGHPHSSCCNPSGAS